jgi:UDP-N-acetylglucosamine 2-epimerase
MLHLENSEIKKPNLILIPSRFEIPSLEDVKGSNIAFSAIEQFLSEYPEVVVKTFTWGVHREAGMRYLQEQGMSEKIQILNPVSRPILRKLFADSLCILDGFTIPASGRIQMEAWAIGTPVLSKQSDELNLKFFDSSTPTFASSTEEEILGNLVKIVAMSKTELANFQHESVLWYKRNHSGDRFLSYLD